MCGWNTFGAWTNHKHTWNYKTHHNLVLGEVGGFPLIVFFVFDHRAYTQMSFCPKTPKLELP